MDIFGGNSSASVFGMIMILILWNCVSILPSGIWICGNIKNQEKTRGYK